MQVIRAKTAGFCFGVSHALATLERQLQTNTETGGRLISLGPIIHNPLVMDAYKARGVVCLDSIDEVRAGDRVVIRAHGISREKEMDLVQSGAYVVDATCPKVKKAQLSIASEAGEGKTLLLLGEKDHPEVQGLISYANGRAVVFSSFSELEQMHLSSGTTYFLAAQTTQGKELFRQVQEYLATVLPSPFTELHTICDATKSRQDEVAALASSVQAFVVVGGLNSGNTRRLALVAQTYGLPAHHVEKLEDLNPALLEDLTCVGLTAGASTPDEHIDAMQQFLEAL